MAGIRIDTPTGNEWDYSLDGQTWQASPKFLVQASGAPFVDGTLYTVHCRNQKKNVRRDVTIIFGEDSSERIFDQVVKSGSSKRKGWTDFLVQLMGGIQTDLPTTSDSDLPQVVIGADGKLYRRGGKQLDYIRVTGPNSFPINQTGQFVATAYYTDGTNKPAVGAVFSVQGKDASINFATGVMTPGPDAEVGGAYTVTASFGGKTYSKGTTLTAASLNFVRTGAPRYLEPIGLLGPNYDGSLDTVTCFQITGWVADLNHPNERAQARLYINGILATTITAHVKREEVSTVLGLTNTTGHIYGFEYTVPAKFRTGQKLVVELRPVSGTNAFRYSPKTSDEGCLDLSNLINVAAGKSVTASSTETANPAWVPATLTSENTQNMWSTPCLGETDQSTVTIDLNGTAAPQQIKILPRQDDPGAMPIAYYVDGSINGTDWFRMATVNNQSRGADEVILQVEKDLQGNYRTCRYVRLTVTKNGQAGGDCPRVQLAIVKVMAPSWTPLDGPPPTKQPQSLLIQGDGGVREGTQTYYKVVQFYTDNSQEDVTTSAQIAYNGGSDVAFEKVGNEARLTIASNNTPNDTRSCQLKAYNPATGLSAFKDVSIYDATAVFAKTYRIDKQEGPPQLVEGTSGSFRIVATMSDETETQYMGAGSYSIIEPYPDGMTAVTGANATCVVTLPRNSITANLDRVLRFTFPAGGGFIERTISLENVNDSQATFDHYDIVGDLTLQESATDAVTGTYQVVEVYSDGSTKDYTGSGSYSIDGNYPDRMTFSTAGAGKGTVTLDKNSISGNLTLPLRFTFGNNSTITKGVQLLNVAEADPCANQKTSIQYAVFEGGQANTFQLHAYYRTPDGKPWQARVKMVGGFDFPFYEMDAFPSGVIGCYKFGSNIGPINPGEQVEINISPDGVNNVITRTVTITGLQARTTLYTAP
ncbi:discoidin domain-containing protein [Spirosoma oryzicola]|uniref:discoidin domain-containing protein n=1 Tax=Spirosoma oryzicola TaxID=2898794 RepID=UPI001E594F87|nr:discoidin domain-containing protein [Spirosoma oryzicola]UHG93431.1 discoidin domain-containing protein [Spirosoma oryzicola]